MLVDKEWNKRKSNKLQKLIRDAVFRYLNACFVDIEYPTDRKLDKSQINGMRQITSTVLVLSIYEITTPENYKFFKGVVSMDTKS